MSRKSRYRKAEVKAGAWILIAGLIGAAFLVAVTGERFWVKLDHYRVRLQYVGGLEVGSPVRMGGLLVGKVSDMQFLGGDQGGLELTLTVDEGLPLKANTVAYLSFISITSEQHLELETSPEPAPLLESGDLVPSKELTTMDQVMEHVGGLGDSLAVILGRVNMLLNPDNLTQVDSIIRGVNHMIQRSSEDMAATFAGARKVTGTLDTLLHDIDNLVKKSDPRVLALLEEASRMLGDARATLAGMDTSLANMDRFMLGNAGEIRLLLDNLSQTSQNLKELSQAVKDNPFLLIRAIPRQERVLGEK
ncbi:MAG: MlaD family protein [Gemmatimonadota bacterium]|nr:MlaD family protein [Gemmatimonadota bacterium]